jgi:hypothetical protein
VTIEGAILARATAHAGLNALIAGRLYTLRMPQNPTYPAVVVTRIAETYEHASGADETTRRALFQFSCWDTEYEDAKDVVDQVVSAFSRYSGTLDSTVIEQVFMENQQDFYDDEAEKHHVAIDATVWYRA